MTVHLVASGAAAGWTDEWCAWTGPVSPRWPRNCDRACVPGELSLPVMNAWKLDGGLMTEGGGWVT